MVAYHIFEIVFEINDQVEMFLADYLLLQIPVFPLYAIKYIGNPLHFFNP